MAKNARFQQLASDLKDLGVESVYLERLRARFDPEQALKELEHELAGEVARALGRTEEQLLLALAELELCQARYAKLAHAGPEDARAQAAQAFNAQRARAEERRRHLIIHREAAGFRRNQVIYDLYPLPKPLPG